MRRSGVLPAPIARRAALRVRPMQRRRLPLAVWVGVLGIAFAALLPVLQTSDATATAGALRELDRDGARLQAEVRLLASQVGELTALARVETVARNRLGLVPARPTTVLTVDEPPPARILPVRLLPLRASATESSRPWWQSVLDLLVVR